MDYEVVIGLEVHAELATRTKIFCGCINRFGGAPNSQCCPVCSGHPGTLPVLNKQAVDYSVRAGLALNCEISRFSKFDRKNYYYPDNPKAFQTSQFDLPLCKNGVLEVEAEGGGVRRVRINRIHLEEDAGKLVHSASGSGTLADFNRCGVPLIEIVTEPDMRSPAEALEFLESLKSILKYSGVSECRMEQGHLRCDVNLSLRKKGSDVYGTRAEIKNVNSFSAAVRAMHYEIERQTDILNSGGTVEQETRRWDEASGRSYVMRTKEDAHDYRYFPEPDLVPVVLTEKQIEDARDTLPMLPRARAQRYVQEYGLPEYDAKLLTADREVSDFFDSCAAIFADKKMLSNWIMSEVLKKLKEQPEGEITVPLSPPEFCSLLKMYSAQEISQAAAREVFEQLWHSGGSARAIVEERGLLQQSDRGELLELVKKLIADNPKPAADYRAGNQKAMAFFVGQAMKATGGRANHSIVSQLVQQLLSE